MAGVGKLLKQAQKMQKQIETLQTDLKAKEIEVTAGGGAVKLKVAVRVLAPSEFSKIFAKSKV